MENGTVVKGFVAASTSKRKMCLVVARPHLGLATGEMIGIDVSISADVQGKNIYVTGIEDKVKLIENLIEAIDHATGRQDLIAAGEMELKSLSGHR